MSSEMTNVDLRCWRCDRKLGECEMSIPELIMTVIVGVAVETKGVRITLYCKRCKASNAIHIESHPSYALSTSLVASVVQ